MAVALFLIVSLVALMLIVAARNIYRIEKEMIRAIERKKELINQLKKPQCANTTAHHKPIKSNDYDYRNTKEGNKTMPSKLCE